VACPTQVPAEQTSRDVTTDEPAATWQLQPAAAGTHVADGQQLAMALAPLVETSFNAVVAPLRAELADVRGLLSARDQELGAALERIRAPDIWTQLDRSIGLQSDSEGSLVETTQQEVRDPKRLALVALRERVSQSQPWSPRRDWNSVRVAARVSATVPSHALPGHLPFSSRHRIR